MSTHIRRETEGRCNAHTHIFVFVRTPTEGAILQDRSLFLKALEEFLAHCPYCLEVGGLAQVQSALLPMPAGRQLPAFLCFVRIHGDSSRYGSTVAQENKHAWMNQQNQTGTRSKGKHI